MKRTFTIEVDTAVLAKRIAGSMNRADSVGRDVIRLFTFGDLKNFHVDWLKEAGIVVKGIERGEC